MESAKLFPSAVGEASLSFDGSDLLESAALLPSCSPPANSPLAPESSAIGCSADARHSELANSEGFLQSGLPNSEGLPDSNLLDLTGFSGEGDPSSGRSATIVAVVGGCVAGMALCAGVAAFAITVARRDACAGDQTAGSPADVQVDSVDEVEDEEDAVSLTNPLDSINVFTSTM
jgi:hypothetical protein